MGMTVSAIMAFGIIYEPYEDDLYPTERFNIPEEYGEDWIEYLWDQDWPIEVHALGGEGCDTYLIAIPDTYASVDWDEALDVDKFMNMELSDKTLDNFHKYQDWLEEYGFKDREPSWLMSSYYG